MSLPSPTVSDDKVIPGLSISENLPKRCLVHILVDWSDVEGGSHSSHIDLPRYRSRVFRKLRNV